MLNSPPYHAKHPTAGAKIHYNLRVVETLVAARVLANRLGLSLGPSDRPRIREIFSRWLGSPELESSPDKVKAGLERFLPEIEKLKPSPEGRPEGQLGITTKEMVEWSGLSEAQFHQVYLSWVDGASPEHDPYSCSC